MHDPLSYRQSEVFALIMGGSTSRPCMEYLNRAESDRILKTGKKMLIQSGARL